MKMKKSIILIALPLLAATFSCNKFKDFGDTNVNPGATTNPIVGALLTNVQAGISGLAASTRDGYYAQYFSETQYSDASLYSLPQIEFAGTYAGALYDLQNIIIQNKSNNQSAVARILKAYIFWTITDRWGDVPYSEALTGNPAPKYDSQEDIYKGIISELTAANAQFDGTSLITGDISSYGGDVDGWKKLANSLRMLMALRLSNKFPAAGGYAATEFAAALSASGGIIDDNSENYSIKYPGGNFKNPWYALYDGRRDVGESKPMTDLTSSLNDGRQVAFAADINGNPTTVGVPYGWKRENVDPWTSANPTWAYVLNNDLRPETGKVVIVSAAQVFLARAEAADRGWVAEDVNAMYTNGIKASFDQWGVAAPAASYFTQSGVVLSAAPGTGANVSKIALQRYIATYPDGLQGWAEQRRTGVPALVPAPDAVGEVVTRYVYGPNEYGSNKANVEAAAAALPGGDKQNSKVWWDQ